MNFISNIKKYAWILVAMPLVFASCSEDIMDDINTDINNPQDADAKFILADVITSTAFSNSGGDFNTYLAAYTEHEVGTHNQLFYTEHRQSQPTSASTFNNTWGSLYTTLKNAKLVIEKTSEGGPQEGDNITKGIAEVMAAYNLALLTDMYGDTPWSEAGDYRLTMTPKVDRQEDIYNDVMEYLDNAIIDLQAGGGNPGPHDMLNYDKNNVNGNVSKWLKFAYGLKARYTMRLINRSTDKNASLQQVIDYANLSFKSASEQAAFAIYNASNLNPLFDFQWSRDGLAASRSIVDKFIERNDPRLHRSFVGADWLQIADVNGLVDPADPASGTYYELMAENGANEQLQYYYNTSIFVFSQTAPTLLQSYHEVLFLKAEAMARLGNSPSAIAPILNEAVLAAIRNTEVSVNAALTSETVLGYKNAAGTFGIAERTSAITEAEAQDYFDNEVLPLFNANPLKEIMNQKYLAFFGASGESTETYNDIRRLIALGEGDLIELENPGKFPLRLPYGNDDTTTNPNVQAAYGDGQYVYTEPVWWAGGTR